MLKILSCAAIVVMASFSEPTVNDGYDIGDPVKDFELKSTKGEIISLVDYKDAKGVILIFDCNTCPISQLYRERIKKLHAKYESAGYPVVAINPNDTGKSPGDSFEKMVQYAAENGYVHDYLKDTDQAVTRRFGATNTPHVFVLKNEGGNFKVAYIGAIDNNTRDGAKADKKYVENAVDALLEDKIPEIEKTKAIGCGIKYNN